MIPTKHHKTMLRWKELCNGIPQVSAIYPTLFKDLPYVIKDLQDQDGQLINSEEATKLEERVNKKDIYLRTFLEGGKGYTSMTRWHR